MDAEGTFRTRPDRLKRYGMLAWGVLAVVSTIASLVTLESVGTTVAMAAGSVLFLWVGYMNYTARLVVTMSGVQRQGFFVDKSVTFDRVATYARNSTREKFVFGDFPDYDWLGLLGHVVKSVTVRPVIAIARLVWFTPNEREFLDYNLVLLDANNNVLFEIEGDDRFVDSHELWSWITTRVDASVRIRTQTTIPMA